MPMNRYQFRVDIHNNCTELQLCTGARFAVCEQATHFSAPHAGFNFVCGEADFSFSMSLVSCHLIFHINSQLTCSVQSPWGYGLLRRKPHLAVGVWGRTTRTCLVLMPAVVRRPLLQLPLAGMCLVLQGIWHSSTVSISFVLQRMR